MSTLFSNEDISGFIAEDVAVSTEGLVESVNYESNESSATTVSLILLSGHRSSQRALKCQICWPIKSKYLFIVFVFRQRQRINISLLLS